MKVRYSLEAFALAFVLYTTGLELALVAGAIIVAATILGDVLAGMAGKTVGAVVAVIAAFAALYFSVSYVGLGAGDYSDYVGAALVAVLIGKHVMDGVDAASTGEILKQNYVALIILAVMALVREFLGGGAVFGYEVADFGVISSAYQNDYFGLIFGGLGIAAVNTIIKKEVKTESLWVAVPVAVMAAIAGASVSAVVAAVIAVVLLISVRGKLTFSCTGKYFACLPVEMISLGFLTMMLTVI